MANAETNVVEAQPRTADGKNVARRERKSGRLPGVVYGARRPSVAVSLVP
ncbi:MAG: 50S ribosomal protein L25, partial [Thermomicrobiales bacterium]